ncbi:MAG: preprotein translocase subunit SecE [Clostridia bacterium]|nr:preprotein translocase subunit SecE [Clostridia bacterium]
MSEEKKTPAKKAEPGKGAKILNWFKTLPQRIVKPFKNMYYELKKVTWPSKQRLISYSIIVLCFMLAMGVVIGLLDMGASAAVRSLIPASTTSGTTTTTTEETAEAVEDAAEAATDAATDAAEAATDAATDAAEAVSDAATDAAEAVNDAAEAATDAASDAAEAVTEAAGEVENAVTEAVGEGLTEGNADAADEGK